MLTRSYIHSKLWNQSCDDGPLLTYITKQGCIDQVIGNITIITKTLIKNFMLQHILCTCTHIHIAMVTVNATISIFVVDPEIYIPYTKRLPDV